ncbi:MAG: PhnD/SsuA/transferrin family substrate-binding protein [Paracoccaceae bacterium]
MYDWPEVEPATAALWRALRRALIEAGFDAPKALSSPSDLWAHWRDPDLLLSQTCGLPFAARLRDAVSLVGAPAYDIPGCTPGRYRSEIVVRADDAAGDVAALKGRRFAYNDRDSQSGWAAFAAAFVDPTAFFRDCIPSGGHRLSIRAVAEGRADAASIDAVSWRLALAHEPAAAELRVLGSTPPTPGLPYITAQRPVAEVDRIAAAVAAGVAMLAEESRAALFLKGFVPLEEAHYAPLAAGWSGGRTHRGARRRRPRVSF